MATFFKVSGAGNDFIIVVEPGESPSGDEIRAWCRRGVSLGADGVIVLSRAVQGARMWHFNSDGQRSDLCLNGSRCAAQLAFFLGWKMKGSLQLLTDAGPLLARRVKRHMGLELPAIVRPPEPRTLEVLGHGYEGFEVDVGVPHFVLPWPESLARVPVKQLGPALRSHPELGPEGANVSFVRYVASDRFEIRTFERGVEGETLACGTGVVASSVVGVATGAVSLPVTAMTSGGFELTVEGEMNEERVVRLELIGDARIVARGELLSGASAVPTPARWS